MVTVVNDDSDAAVAAFFEKNGGDWPKVTDPDGAIVSRRWDFGCGNPSCTSTDVAPLYTFETPGTYTVTLTVTDADGLVSQATEVVEVAEL